MPLNKYINKQEIWFQNYLSFYLFDSTEFNYNSISKNTKYMYIVLILFIHSNALLGNLMSRPE